MTVKRSYSGTGVLICERPSLHAPGPACEFLASQLMAGVPSSVRLVPAVVVGAPFRLEDGHQVPAAAVPGARWRPSAVAATCVCVEVLHRDHSPVSGLVEPVVDVHFFSRSQYSSLGL